MQFRATMKSCLIMKCCSNLILSSQAVFRYSPDFCLSESRIFKVNSLKALKKSECVTTGHFIFTIKQQPMTKPTQWWRDGKLAPASWPQFSLLTGLVCPSLLVAVKEHYTKQESGFCKMQTSLIFRCQLTLCVIFLCCSATQHITINMTRHPYLTVNKTQQE